MIICLQTRGVYLSIYMYAPDAIFLQETGNFLPHPNVIATVHRNFDVVRKFCIHTSYNPQRRGEHTSSTKGICFNAVVSPLLFLDSLPLITFLTLRHLFIESTLMSANNYRVISV